MQIGKEIRRGLDRLFGPATRTLVRNAIFHPIFELLYDVEIVGKDIALTCTEGAFILARHKSFADPPLLLSYAYPYARVRPTAHFKQYYNPLQWPFMLLCGTVPLGSPTKPPRRWAWYIRDTSAREHLWKIERQMRKATAMLTMSKILSYDKEKDRVPRFLLFFPEGGIGDGDTVNVPLHLTGVHDLIEEHPEKPVLMVNIEGLEYSRLGKKRPAAPLFRRLRVKITVERFDNVSLEGGHEALNQRIADYYRHGTPLKTKARIAA